jgi:hypothetical protein
MKKRYPQLVPYLKGGNVGEDNKGFLVAKDLQGLDLKGQATVRRLVDAENKERGTLYAEIVRALKIDPSQKLRVQQIFAEKWQASAPKGTWVQKTNGSWTRK